mgnify:CR=1 FL=1
MMKTPSVSSPPGKVESVQSYFTVLVAGRNPIGRRTKFLQRFLVLYELTLFVSYVFLRVGPAYRPVTFFRIGRFSKLSDIFVCSSNFCMLGIRKVFI